MRKSRKKLLAMILAFTMVFGTLPSNAFANNEQEQINTGIEETVTTDVSENVENENLVEDITEKTQEEANTEEVQAEAKVEEEALPEDNADTEVAVDSSLEEIKLEKTEEIKAGEKYIIVYDNKKALAIGKDSIIAVPVEVEEDIIKTEITKNIIWTVDDNNNLVSELGNDLLSELNLQQERQFLEFNEKNISYVNQEVNTHLTFNEETKKWSFEENKNTNINYYSVTGYTTTLRELSNEELIAIEEGSKENQIKQDSDIQSNYESNDKVEEISPNISIEGKESSNEQHEEVNSDSVERFDVILYDYAIDKDSEFKFTDEAYLSSYDLVNGYNGNNGGRRIVQGLVKNKLVDGNIEFNYDSSQELFRVDSSKRERLENVYTGVQFPFIKDNKGYYTFDSSKYHVHSNRKNDEVLALYENGQSFGNNKSFFPFNTHNDTNPNYFFGMNLGINFYMPEDGKINLGNGNTENMVFEFTGDDDVWVFVDGKLVLDLGGIHQPVYGKIDFNAGKVTYGSKNLSVKDFIYDLTLDGDKKVNSNTDYGLEKDLWELLELDDKDKDKFLKDTKQLHTLQVFYLERGAGDSNCMIKFNMPQKDTLDVTKQLALGTPIPKIDKFTFSIKNGEEPYSEEEYYIYKGTSIEGGPYSTDKEGKFTLQSGYTAKFIEPKNGTYTIEEIDDRGYITNWNTSNGYFTNNKIATVEIEDKGSGKFDKYYATCINSADVTLEHDVIVVDYGKPIRFNVINNDNFNPLTLSNWRFIGIDSYKSTSTDNFKHNYIYDNGELDVFSNDGTLEYTPTKFFDTINKATYAISYEANSSTSQVGTETKYKYANITIMPATSVYYEDNFGNTSNDYGSNEIIFTGNWISEDEDIEEEDSNVMKPEGQYIVSYQDPDQDKNYGYDSSYNNNTGLSGGSATVIKGDGETVNASFTFKGTGFDLISRTKNDTGSIVVTISKVNSDKSLTQVKNTIVNNTYYSGDLYQIPVINFYTEEYATYQVDITVGETVFYLDAIRVYNPLGFNEEKFQDAYDRYKDDGEANAVISELRNMLLSTNPTASIEKDNNNNNNNRFVFVDSKDGKGNSASDLTTYANVGPNNEVYLANGQAIAFTVPKNSDLATIQVGLKAPNGEVTAGITGTNVTSETKILKTATDMYYPVTFNKDANGNYTVVITNNSSNSSNVLSITNLKLTYADKQSTETTRFFSDINTIVIANMLAYESNNNKSADIDGSGVVDIMDLAAVANNQDKEVIIGVSTDIYRQDLTGTRTINRDDLNIVRDNLQ